jgi:hypothetical protein
LADGHLVFHDFGSDAGSVEAFRPAGGIKMGHIGTPQYYPKLKTERGGGRWLDYAFASETGLSASVATPVSGVCRIRKTTDTALPHTTRIEP